MEIKKDITIMKNTKYQIATGGTPIISWIPNQIGAVLKYMNDILESFDKPEKNPINQDEIIPVLSNEPETPKTDLVPIVNDEKIYYISGKLIGNEFETKKHIIAHTGIAPTKAKKQLLKIKQWIEQK